MSYTPFSSEEAELFLSKMGIVFTKDKSGCDVFVSRLVRKLPRYIIKYPTRKYLIWTHEPRDNKHIKYFGNRIKGLFGIPNVHIMNAYTGDVHINNYSIFAPDKHQTIPYIDEINFPNFKHKKTVILTEYRNNKRAWSWQQGGKELDLCYLRTKIALVGHRLNKIDIYGKGWPDGISIENSRGKGWQARKQQILENYHFNLCFENTNIDYYCSEKIWDSIYSGCLPIYYGNGNKIYEDFPRNSFLDYCDFENAEDMFKYIENMSLPEFRHRLNLCIEVFNEVVQKRKFPRVGSYSEEVILRIVQKIQQIVDFEDNID